MESFILFLLKKCVEAFLNPPFMAFVIIACGLLVCRRRPSAGLLLGWCGLLVGLFFTMPATVSWMAKNLETCPVVDPARLKDGQVIVILGGGEKNWAREYRAAAPVGETLERVRYGARLSRQSALPVLVSGGATPGNVPEAAAMAEVLKTDFGLTARWTEDRSLDTADNARYSAAILKNAGITKVILVTSAAHMRRAEYEFRRAGLEVIPAPTAFLSDTPAHREIYEYLPGLSTAAQGAAVLHEWIGILSQHLRDSLSR
jgi:uncharacterized SAM-binding protein YcdF (DUF218 family)